MLEEKGREMVGRNGGSPNGKRGRTVLDREGVPIATSQNSEWPFAARPLPITLKIDWKSITKRPRKQDSSILSVFWPGGGLNPYLIIITFSKARRGVRGGQFQNKRFKSRSEMAAPPGHGTWNAEREAGP